MKRRIVSNQIGHAMAIVQAVEESKPGDVISVNNEQLAQMARFKLDQYKKDIEVVVEETDGNENEARS